MCLCSERVKRFRANSPVPQNTTGRAVRVGFFHHSDSAQLYEDSRNHIMKCSPDPVEICVPGWCLECQGAHGAAHGAALSFCHTSQTAGRVKDSLNPSAP